jgi:hypothetical protein
MIESTLARTPMTDYESAALPTELRRPSTTYRLCVSHLPKIESARQRDYRTGRISQQGRVLAMDFPDVFPDVL